LARAAEQRLVEFTVQGLANMAWAFATGVYLDEELFAALARAAEQHVVAFNTEGLGMTSGLFRGLKG